MGFCLVLAWVGVSGSASQSQAEAISLPGEVSGSVAIATDYAYRGVSQTVEDIAMSSSIDWSHESGVYLGVWGSNVDFGDGTELEMDIYGGYASELMGISYDVGILGYLYPGARSGDQDFLEFTLGLGYDAGFASASLGVAISPEFYANAGVGTHLSAGIAMPVPVPMLEDYGVAVDVNFGLQVLEDAADFVHYDVGLGFELVGFGLDIRYIGAGYTDGIGKLDDDRVIFGISRGF
jgi:uncharacterized protein (TIGR02001 family)